MTFPPGQVGAPHYRPKARFGWTAPPSCRSCREANFFLALKIAESDKCIVHPVGIVPPTSNARKNQIRNTWSSASRPDEHLSNHALVWEADPSESYPVSLTAGWRLSFRDSRQTRATRLNLLCRTQRPHWAAAGFNVCDDRAGLEWYSPATSSRDTPCLNHNPPRETVGQQAESGENYRNGTSRCEGRGSLLQRDMVRPQPQMGRGVSHKKAVASRPLESLATLLHCSAVERQRGWLMSACRLRSDSDGLREIPLTVAPMQITCQGAGSGRVSFMRHDEQFPSALCALTSSFHASFQNLLSWN